MFVVVVAVVVIVNEGIVVGVCLFVVLVLEICNQLSLELSSPSWKHHLDSTL